MGVEQIIESMSPFEPETEIYSRLPGASLNKTLIDQYIKAVKYGSGVILSGQTMGLFITSGGALINTPLTDLRWAVGISKFSIAAGGKTIVGYPSVAGIAEGLAAASNVSTCANSASYPYETFTGASATGFTAANTSGYGVAGTAKEVPITLGDIWKATWNLTLNSGALPASHFEGDFGTTSASPLVTAVSGANSQYIFPTLTSTIFRYDFQTDNNIAASFAIANLAVQKVTAPSLYGVTIVSTKGGTTRNWASNTGIVAADVLATGATITITAN
jgi:hypothetical protein